MVVILVIVVNLYNLHVNPSILYRYKDRWMVPGVVRDMIRAPGFVKDSRVERVLINSNDYESVYWYARHVIEGRWIDGEQCLSRSAQFSYLYAKHILNDRFELGEGMIAVDMQYAYLYAKNVLKGRFELGERILSSDCQVWLRYRKNVLKLGGEDE